MSQRGSQAMKRWYQLSMLQMLVGLSVMAVFIYMNATISATMPVKMKASSFSIVFNDDPLVISKLKSGWPLAYWQARGTVERGRVLFAADQVKRPLAIAANLAICATSIFLAVLAVSWFTRRSASSSAAQS